MSISVLHKAIALLLLIGMGYWLKPKFPEPTAIVVLRNFILNAALPATIFLSTIEINTNLDLVLLPAFAVGINLYLLAIGFGIAKLLFKSQEAAQARALILLFPSLAPGLTVYPFIEQFSGRQGLAWAALADMGNKLFVLIGLYILAFVWMQRSQRTSPNGHPSGRRRTDPAPPAKMQWASLGKFLVGEPVNGAIVLGIAFAAFGISASHLPLAIADAIEKLALCATPLILIYVGLSLKLRSLQWGRILTILIARSGASFVASAIALVWMHPRSPEMIMLLIALPQASCSLWPLLHALKINELQPAPAEPAATPATTTAFFDTEFGTALIAMSFPYSIFTLLFIFSSDQFFHTPTHLWTAGGACWVVVCGLTLVQRTPFKLQSPIQIKVNWRQPIVRSRPQQPVQELTPSLSRPVAPRLPPQAAPFSAEDQRFRPPLGNLETMMQTGVQKVLGLELGPNRAPVHLDYARRDRSLVIMVQHLPQSQPPLLRDLDQLNAEIQAHHGQSLTQQGINRIRLYFKVLGQTQPYACYPIPLTSHDDLYAFPDAIAAAPSP